VLEPRVAERLAAVRVVAYVSETCRKMARNEARVIGCEELSDDELLDLFAAEPEFDFSSEGERPYPALVGTLA
jgi:hypothetical protein